MRKCLSLLVIATALLSGVFAFGQASPEEKWKGHTGKLPWIIGYEKGMAEAKFSGRPAFIFFTTTW